jgi:hypothetical protein
MDIALGLCTNSCRRGVVRVDGVKLMCKMRCMQMEATALLAQVVSVHLLAQTSDEGIP